MRTKNNPYVLKNSYRQILNISIPIMIGSLAYHVVNIIDTAFLGRVGEIELAASAIGGTLYFVLSTIGYGFSIGTQITIARRAGENRTERIGEVIDNSIYAMVFFMLAIFIFLKYLSPTALGILLSSKEVYTVTIEYLEYRSYGIFFPLLSMVPRALFVGLGNTRIIITAGVIEAICNIFFDYCLIFGRLGFPQLGIVGAAIASVVSEGIFLFTYTVYLFYKGYVRRYKLLAFKRSDPKLIQNLLSLSSPIVLQNMFSLGGWFIFFVIIERISAHALAISNIVKSIYFVMMIPIWAFAATTNTIISNTVGQRKMHKIGKAILRLIMLSFGSTLLFTSIVALLPKTILSICTNNQALIDDSVTTLFITLIALLMFSVSTILFNTVVGLGDTRKSLYFEAVSVIIYLIYSYLAGITLNLGLEMTWIAEIIYWSVLLIFAVHYMIKCEWKKKIFEI